MRLVRLTFATTLILAVLAAPLTAHPQQPAQMDAEQAAALAPRLDSRRTDTRSFEVKGTLPLGANWAFHCFYGVPQRACAIWFDDVPVFVASGDQIFLYDPMSGPRLWHGGWSVAVGKRPDRDGISIEYNLLNPENESVRIEVDVASIVALAPRERTVRSVTRSVFLLEGRSEDGGSLQAWIGMMQPGRYSRVTARSNDGTVGPDIWIMSVDEPVPGDAFRFPRFGERLNVPAPTPVTLDTLGEGIKQIVTALFFHVGMANPTQRPELEKVLGRSLDWEGLREREAAMAPLLKEILGENGSLAAR
jgi:hypothetical protein